MDLRILPLLVPLALLLGNAAAENGAVPISPQFVVVAPVTVPIVECDRLAGSMTVKLVLDAGDAEGAHRLTGELPQLREAALLAAMEFARLRASAHRPLDAERLDKDLKTAIAATDPGVKRVLITQITADAA